MGRLRTVPLLSPLPPGAIGRLAVYWALVACMQVSVVVLMTADADWRAVLARALQHAMLFPPLVLACALAFRIGWPPVRPLTVAAQALLAVGFALLGRFALWCGAAIAHGTTTFWLTPSQMDPGFESRMYAAATLQFLFAYAVAVLLLASMTTAQRLARSELELARVHHAWTQARLQALRVQLNPHFLFNVLAAIREAVDTDAQIARRMLVRLADLLRRALSGSEDEWQTLGEELRFAEGYLELQAWRFGRRLRYSITCDGALHGHVVPALCLQPLVENAVVHGGAGGEPVEIAIACARAGGRLRIEVANSRSRGATVSGHGTGLRNLRERLDATCGAAAELAVEQRAGRHVATLLLPLEGRACRPPMRAA
jgi:hypothetical protein